MHVSYWVSFFFVVRLRFGLSRLTLSIWLPFTCLLLGFGLSCLLLQLLLFVLARLNLFGSWGFSISHLSSQQIYIHHGCSLLDLRLQPIAIPVEVERPEGALLNSHEALVSRQCHSAVLSGAVEWSCELSLCPLARAKLHFVRLRIHVDPIHDGRFVCDGCHQSGMLCAGICEIVSLKWVTKGYVIVPSRIDV